MAASPVSCKGTILFPPVQGGWLLVGLFLLPLLPALSLHHGPLGLVLTPWLLVLVPAFLLLAGWGLGTLMRESVWSPRLWLGLAILALPFFTSRYAAQTLYPTLALLTAVLSVPLLRRYVAPMRVYAFLGAGTLLALGIALWLWVRSNYHTGSFGGQFLHQNYLGGFLLLSSLGLPAVRKLPPRGAAGVILAYALAWVCLAYACDSRAIVLGLAVFAGWWVLCACPRQRGLLLWGGMGLLLVGILLVLWLQPWWNLGRYDLTRLGWYVAGLQDSLSWRPQGFGTFGLATYQNYPAIPTSHSGALQSHSLWVELVQSYGVGGWVLLGLLGSWLCQRGYRALVHDLGRWPFSVLLSYLAFATLDSQIDVVPLVFLCALAAGLVEHEQMAAFGPPPLRSWKKTTGLPALGALSLVGLLVLAMPMLGRDLQGRVHLWKAKGDARIAVLEQLATEQGDNLAYPFAYGWVLIQSEDERVRREGMMYLKHVIKHWPEYAPAWVEMGRAQEGSSPLLAVYYYSEALRRVPGHAAALFGIARVGQNAQLRNAAFRELVMRHPQYLAWTRAGEYSLEGLAAELENLPVPWGTVRSQLRQLGRALDAGEAVPPTLDLEKLEKTRYEADAARNLRQLAEAGLDWSGTAGKWPRQAPRGVKQLILRNLDLPPLEVNASWEHYPSLYVRWSDWRGIYGPYPRAWRDWDACNVPYSLEGRDYCQCFETP